MKERNKAIIQMVIASIGVIGGVFVINLFNQYVLTSLPIVWRMVLMIVTYFMIALVPFCISVINKDKLYDFGFTKEKLGYQMLVGFLIALCFSFVFTVIPHLAGKSDWVNNNHQYQYMWQFVYDFVYYIFAVALVEEFVFRGFFYKKLETVFDSKVAVIIVSSVLFGLFHFYGGNIAQIILTGIIGVILCICRVKIKNCTLLSLIIAHGVYDSLITVWLNVFT
ncbi:MAG: type II CAAX endopeptidase family protein [Ruminococcus sp.]|nr:type II CAAX endopeptidase family protein [Ruminococcus sp.]